MTTPSQNNNGNGTRLVWFILKTAIGLILAASLSYAGWVGKTLVAQDDRIDKLETRMTVIEQKLDLILMEVRKNGNRH